MARSNLGIVILLAFPIGFHPGREGILERLEGDDRAAVEEWLATLPSKP